MRIYEFRGEKLEFLTPKKVTHNEKTHFNIRLGDYSEGCWEYVMGIDDNIVDLKEPPKALNDNYYLVNLMTKSQEGNLKDKIGNDLYYIKEIIGKDENPSCMLCLSLTSRSVLDITIVDDGNVRVLGKYSKKLQNCKDMKIYIFKPDDVLVFDILNKLDTVRYKITMGKNRLVLTTVN